MNSKLFTSLITVILLTSCNNKDSKNLDSESVENTPVIPVIAQTPELKEITLYLETIGQLIPSILMEVYPQVSGSLEEVLVKEGQWVEQGTPLFIIDQTPYKIKIQEDLLLTNYKIIIKILNQIIHPIKEIKTKD